MLMMAGIVCGTSASVAEAAYRGKASTRDVISLVRNYNHHEGFEIVYVGKLGISLAHMIANANADEDGTATIIDSIRDITADKEKLAYLVDECNRLELPPIHLRDVIEDFVG